MCIRDRPEPQNFALREAPLKRGKNTHLPRRAGRAGAFAAGAAAKVAAVSYTHLDVYKRQVEKDVDNPMDNTSGSSTPSPESRFQNRENHDSGAVKITDQESLKSRSNNTENNDTDSFPFTSVRRDHGREAKGNEAALRLSLIHISQHGVQDAVCRSLFNTPYMLYTKTANKPKTPFCRCRLISSSENP